MLLNFVGILTRPRISAAPRCIVVICYYLFLYGVLKNEKLLFLKNLNRIVDFVGIKMEESRFCMFRDIPSIARFFLPERICHG